MTTKILFAKVMNVIPEVIFKEVERFIVLHHDGTIELSGNKQKLTIKDKDNNVLGWVSCRQQNPLSSRVRIWIDDWESDPKKSEYWRNAIWRSLTPNPEKTTIMQHLIKYLSREFMIDEEVNTAVFRQPEPADKEREVQPLLSDIMRMKKHYSGYTPDTAKKIYEPNVQLWRRPNHLNQAVVAQAAS